MKKMIHVRSQAKDSVVVNRYDIVLLKWVDAHQDPFWRDVNGLSMRHAFVNSIGFFLGEDDESWVLAPNHIWSQDMVDTMCIPKGMIQSVEVLRRADNATQAGS